MDMFAAFKDSFAENQIFLPALLSFVGGVLTALSPCVYPIVPVTIVVMGAHRSGSRSRNLAIAATYVAGMVLLYTGLSVVFTSLGMLAGSLFQHPAFIFATGLLFMLLALSLFGFFNFTVPHSLLTWAGKVGGVGFGGAFLMGLVSGLIAAPCTGPVLGFLLTLIAKNGVYSRGIFWMLFFALGMGLPFLLLGAFSQAIGSLPKSGRFMTVAKVVLGGAILVSGMYYIYIGYDCLVDSCEERRQNLGERSNELERADGEAGRWVLVDSSEAELKRLDALLADAKRRNKPVVIDFFAHWCVACKDLEKALRRPQVASELERFVAIRVDATRSSRALMDLQRRWGVVGLPTMVFVSGAGHVLQDRTMVGVVGLDAVLAALRSVH
jgi:thiol:disulfide interchange protein DsbD